MPVILVKHQHPRGGWGWCVGVEVEAEVDGGGRLPLGHNHHAPEPVGLHAPPQPLHAPGVELPREHEARARAEVAEGKVADAGVEVHDDAPWDGRVAGEAAGEDAGFLRDVAAGEHGVEGGPGLVEGELRGGYKEGLGEDGGGGQAGGVRAEGAVEGDEIGGGADDVGGGGGG